jgi:hypothetical protein
MVFRRQKKDLESATDRKDRKFLQEPIVKLTNNLTELFKLLSAQHQQDDDRGLIPFSSQFFHDFLTWFYLLYLDRAALQRFILKNFWPCLFFLLVHGLALIPEKENRMEHGLFNFTYWEIISVPIVWCLALYAQAALFY